MLQRPSPWFAGLAGFAIAMMLAAASAVSIAEETGSSVDDVTALVARFIAHPGAEHVLMSPDGTRVAYSTVRDDEPVLEVIDLSNRRVITSTTDPDEEAVFDLLWAGANVVFRTHAGDSFWMPGVGPFVAPVFGQSGATKLHYGIAGPYRLLKPAAKDDRYLFSFLNRRRVMRPYGGLFLPLRPSVAAIGGRSDLTVIQTMGDNWNSPSSRVGIYNLDRSRLGSFVKFPGRMDQALADVDGNIVATYGEIGSAAQRQRRATYQLRYLHDDGGWQVAHEADFREGEVVLIGQTKSPSLLYIAENVTGDTIGLSTLSRTNGHIERQFEVPGADLVDFHIDGAGHLYAVELDNPLPTFHYVDPGHPAAVAHRELAARFQDQVVRFTSISADNRRAIASIAGPDSPPRYSLIDIEGPRSSPLLQSWSGLVDNVPGKTRVIAFNEAVSGVLTEPANAHGPSPLVVRFNYPFRAPRAEFNEEAQLFASAGFAHLRVDRRGLAGNGKARYRAGLGKWQSIVLDDIAVAVDGLVAANIVAPQRVCTLGTGLGATLALLAVIDRPVQFHCAIGIRGMYDLSAVATSNRGRAQRDFVEDAVGPGKTSKALRRVSPRWRTDKLRHPVLLVEASQFRSDASRDAREFIRNARKRGATVEVFKQNGDNTRLKLDLRHRRAAYVEIIRFMNAHLTNKEASASRDGSQPSAVALQSRIANVRSR